jgi:hypothetical protein
LGEDAMALKWKEILEIYDVELAIKKKCQINCKGGECISAKSTEEDAKHRRR